MKSKSSAKKSNQEVKVLAINVLHEYAEKYFNYEKRVEYP